MNSSYFQTMAEVPLQQGRVQQVLFRAHDTHKSFDLSSRNRFTQFFPGTLSCAWEYFLPEQYPR